MKSFPHRLSAETLASLVDDAADRTRALVDDLSDEEWAVPRLDIINPVLWEVGHVAFFYEAFVLQELDGTEPRIANGRELFDSFVIQHDDRWSAPLPDRRSVWEYKASVEKDVHRRLEDRAPDARETYVHLLAVYHEDMHDEAFLWTRQTLGYSPPAELLARAPVEDAGGGPLPGDVAIPGGGYWLGATVDLPFVFDNEKWAHPVEVKPFRIARAPVTNAEFARFVDDGGYEREACWGYEGWRWRARADASHPVYWRRGSSGWEMRRFDRWAPLEPHRPVIHVNWFEAQAWCRWAGRRLPSEAEWEAAASSEPRPDGAGLRTTKRRYPWGDELPSTRHANLDFTRLGCVDVGAYPESESAFGCRQMIGNVWEWTASPFYPFPGYVVDHPYKEYSAPWFGDRKVLRGGAWATRGRLIRNTWRNFFTPDRRDVFAGFRTCAL